MYSLKPCVLLCSLLLCSTVFASPKIDFDKTAFQCGTLIEGKVDKVNAVFVVKNTGDSVLKLIEVKPGCGCTVVKYDTFVQPGKTVKIESVLNIKGYRSGPISKAITVTSNAANQPVTRLTIEATIQSTVDISDNFINLNTSATVPYRLNLASKKRDLKFTDVTFVPESAGNAAVWQKKGPIVIKYTWEAKDSARADSMFTFTANLFRPSLEKMTPGEFIFKTNHPDAQEMKVRGMVSN